MCGRFTLKTPLGKWLFELFGEQVSSELPSVQPRFNIAPTQSILIATRRPSDGTFQFEFARWGLVPSWAKDMEFGATLINARLETLASKPAFRSAFKRSRCGVIADGYYEWQELDKRRKQPFWIHRKQDAPFVIAGLADLNQQIEPDKPIRSATIVTTDSNDSLSVFHDRMPVVLDSLEKILAWISDDPISQEECGSAFGPAPDNYFETRPVSSLVGNPKNEDSRCIEEQPNLWQRNLDFS